MTQTELNLHFFTLVKRAEADLAKLEQQRDYLASVAEMFDAVAPIVVELLDPQLRLEQSVAVVRELAKTPHGLASFVVRSYVSKRETMIGGVRAVIARADDVEPGHALCFHDSSRNFTVEDVSVSSMGNITLRYNDGTASSSYKAGETVFVSTKSLRGRV